MPMVSAQRAITRKRSAGDEADFMTFSKVDSYCYIWM
jgi:hypothetical protein